MRRFPSLAGVNLSRSALLEVDVASQLLLSRRLSERAEIRYRASEGIMINIHIHQVLAKTRCKEVELLFYYN